MGCSKGTSGGAARAVADAASGTLTLGAYTTPREAYAQIIPAFRDHHLAQTGVAVTFAESYLGSGAQARAIVAGSEADIAALSLEADIDVLRDAKLVTSDPKALPHAGIVSHSLVVLGVRPGNPKNIRDWDDLTAKGIGVLTPNLRTSAQAYDRALAQGRVVGR